MEDIIGIQNLVQSFKENAFSFGMDRETDRESIKDTDNNNNKNNKNKNNRPYCMTPLTDELKNMSVSSWPLNHNQKN